jgi:hypothetical protein
MPSRLFPLIRPAYEDEPEVDLASAAARSNPDLSAGLQRQIAFDDEVVAQLRTLALNDAQIGALEDSLLKVDAPPAPPPTPTSSTPLTPSTPLTTPTPPTTSTPSTTPTPPKTPTPVAAANAPGPGALRPGTVVEAVTPPKPESQDLPKTEEEAEDEEEDQPRARPVTIFFAIGVCFIAAIGVVGYILWDQMNSFKGADRIADLLDSANGLTGDEFEAVQTTTGALKDWFLLKNEHFAVPKEFGTTRTIQARVFQFHSASVGQVMAKDDRQLLYFLFDPASLGVKLHKGKWEIVEGERFVGGITEVEDTCFIVAFPGKHDDMQTYLAQKVPK